MNTAMMVAVLSIAVVAALGVASAVARGRLGPGRGVGCGPGQFPGSRRAASAGGAGVGGGRSGGSGGVADDRPAAAELLSDFEVSRAIGVSVEGVPAVGGRPRSGRWETSYHPLRGGERLMQASVFAGRAGRAAIRAYRRRGRPLSHAGDLAFKGDDWVLGQRGDVVVLLCQHDPANWRVSGGLPWLLSTALDRVPGAAARLNRA